MSGIVAALVVIGVLSGACLVMIGRSMARALRRERDACREAVAGFKATGNDGFDYDGDIPLPVTGETWTLKHNESLSVKVSEVTPVWVHGETLDGRKFIRTVKGFMENYRKVTT